MALRATIHKAEVHVADNDRGYYASHSLTVARHPSETDERMMVRLLTYALYAGGDHELVFTRGLSDTDEPALWRHDLTGAIVQWVETGLPDERRILKACGRANAVLVMAYGRTVDLWWQGVQRKVERARNLTVQALDPEGTSQLAALAERNMILNINIQDQAAWVSSERGEASVNVRRLHDPRAS